MMIQITGVMTLHVIVTAVQHRDRRQANENERGTVANVENLNAEGKQG